jgi:magnesium transporter
MQSPASDLSRTLMGLLRNANDTTIRNVLLQWSLQEVAGAVVRLPEADRARVLRTLPLHAASAVFEYLPLSVQRELQASLPQADLAALLNDMAPDDRTLFLSELPEHATRSLLSLLDPIERAKAEALLAYPPDSVGRFMTPEYVAIREDWSVQRVLDHVRAYGHDSETLDVLYVVDDGGLLIDDLRIRELLLVPVTTPIRGLMNRRFAALHATDSQRAAIEVFRQEDRTALPVVDARGALIGIVTIDDILDASHAIATRDLQRVGGSDAIEAPYFSVSTVQLIRKRAGWLTILFLGEMLTASAMGFFEDEIAQAVVLALFVPLIISSGGNSGSQAATLMIRALSIGEIGAGDWRRVLRREILAGLALGMLLGVIGFVRIAAWSALTDLYGPHWLFIAMTVGAALIGVVLWGAIAGSMLPFVVRRLGADPAVSSAPLVATLVDVTGLVIYFSVAIVLLRGRLL